MAGIGHNSYALNSAAEKALLAIVKKIERLKAEQKEIGTEISDIKKEAKSKGYDGKALNRLLSERAKYQRDPDKYQDEMNAFDVYWNALGRDD